MYIRKKMRIKIIAVAVVVLGFIFWRGLKATTEKSFTCEYKLIYAVCKPKNNNSKMPTLLEIFKAGVKF
jgi:hypothetical protein